MLHNPDPLIRFVGVLGHLRDLFKRLVPAGQLPKPPDKGDPYSLHNFIALKISDFINDDDPHRRDLLIEAALKALNTTNAILNANILKSKTILNLVEAIVSPSLSECCAAVFDSVDREGVLAKKLSELPDEDLTKIKDIFERLLALADWPNRDSFVAPKNARTVKVAISEGLK